MLQQIQSIAYDAYKAGGQAAALLVIGGRLVEDDGQFTLSVDLRVKGSPDFTAQNGFSPKKKSAEKKQQVRVKYKRPFA